MQAHGFKCIGCLHVHSTHELSRHSDRMMVSLPLENPQLITPLDYNQAIIPIALPHSRTCFDRGYHQQPP